MFIGCSLSRFYSDLPFGWYKPGVAGNISPKYRYPILSPAFSGLYLIHYSDLLEIDFECVLELCQFV